MPAGAAQRFVRPDSLPAVGDRWIIAVDPYADDQERVEDNEYPAVIISSVRYYLGGERQMQVR